MENKYFIDKNVGLTALQMYIKNANLEVGVVTVRHLIFAELIVQMKANDKLDDAKEVFRLCFHNEDKPGIQYVSPLGKVQISEDGIPFKVISPRLAQLIYKRCCEMSITRENVLAACDDLITCGRMYQELTIDACKTMFNVNIPYGEDMSHCHLLSRDREDDDLNIRCDWKGAAAEASADSKASLAEHKANNALAPKSWKRYKNVMYILNENKSITQKVKRGKEFKTIRFVADFMQSLRSLIINKGKNLAADLMDIKQDFPEELRNKIRLSMMNRDMQRAKAVGRLYHDIYRTVTSYRSNEISKARTIYKKGSLGLENKISDIKSKANEAYSAISNQIRVEFDRLHIPANQRIYVLLDIVLEEGDNSPFAHVVLPEEFFLMVLDLYKDNPDVPKYTEDELITCSFEENSVVTFEYGLADDIEGHYARAVLSLDGEYIIRKNNHGRLVASKFITDLVQIPEADPTKLCFVTKAGGGRDIYTCNHIEKISKEMADTEVYLIPYGNNLHDSIVVDNKEIGHFRCTAQLDKMVTADMMKRMNSAVTGIYRNKKGIIDRVISSNMGEGVGKVAVVILRNVEECAAVPTHIELLSERISKEKKAISEDANKRIIAMKKAMGLNVKEEVAPPCVQSSIPLELFFVDNMNDMEIA